MQEIPFHRIGIIKGSKHPREIGWYITVQDDTQISGGYKIFTSNNIDFEMDSFNQSKILFDGWVENKELVPVYFKEAEYQVEWTPDQIMIEWPDDGKGWKWKRI